MSTYKGIAVSVIGRGHILRGLPCQDASAVSTDNELPYLIVCDGRGSAKMSDIGAKTAILAFQRQLSIFTPYLKRILNSTSHDNSGWDFFCKIIYRTLAEEKRFLAEKYSCSEKEFDYTIAFSIIGETNIGCFQVGDCAIILKDTTGLRSVFSPEKGEYANQTTFLRASDKIVGHYQSSLCSTKSNIGIMITSDGPTHQMLRLSDMKPLEICEQFFNDLIKDDLKEFDIREYLSLPEWANDPRGDDDKSIAILVHHSNGEVKQVKNQITEETYADEKTLFSTQTSISNLKGGRKYDEKKTIPSRLTSKIGREHKRGNIIYRLTDYILKAGIFLSIIWMFLDYIFLFGLHTLGSIWRYF